MKVSGITPILNVSNIKESIEWFRLLGWQTGFQWGEPESFASVCQSDCEIFLSLDGQGGRGKGINTSTFGDTPNESSDKGVWMSLWVENVDDAFKLCTDVGIDITFPPTNMPWNVREMHIRHPDGHVFRVGQGIER